MREIFRPIAIMSGVNQKRRDHRVSDEESAEKASRDAASLSRWWVPAAAGLIIAAGALAYANSFHGPFIFDDQAIYNNPHVRRLWPIWEAMTAPPETTAAGRPVLSLTLALNYAISGLGVWSYHVFNLVVHILAAMVLFGIVRRTLLSERLRERFGKASATLALICALLWLLHPLQTQAVTYVIQRAESLMGLFYLLTLYCAIRSFTSAHKRWWCAAAIVSCALGMGTKEVMATAPLMVLLYDRLFVARSFKEVFRRRWVLYAGLAATWVILGALVATGPRAKTVGLGLQITPLDYAATQCNVIVNYLRLSFWPSRLVLDYGWPIAKNFGDFALSGAVLAALLAGTLVAFRYRPALGFLGVWFFVILGPSSSFLPIVTEVGAEHRMYLSLAAVVVLVVICGYALGRRLSGRLAASDARRKMLGRVLGYSLAGAVVVTFGLLTARRNVDYRSKISIWQDTVNKRPNHARSQLNLGFAFGQKGKLDGAVTHFTRALELRPNYAKAHSNLGLTLAKQGKPDQAIMHFNRALKIKPNYTKAHYNLGLVLAKQKKLDQAIKCFNKALELKPDYSRAHHYLGVALASQEKLDQAVVHFSRSVQLESNYAETHYNLGLVLAKQGKLDQAITHFNKALELKPDHPKAHHYLGVALANRGKIDQAVVHFSRAVQLDPDYAEAHCKLGLALGRQDRTNQAIAHLTEAIGIEPDYTEAHYNLGVALARAGKTSDAVRHYRHALRLDGDRLAALNNLAWILATNENPELRDGPEAVRLAERACELTDYKDPGTLDTLGVAYAEAGRFAEAVTTAEEAVRLAASAGEAQLAREIQSRLELYKLKRPYRHRSRSDAPPNP